MATTRITTDPSHLGGTPCIRGLDIPVSRILELADQALSRQEILDAIPGLEGADINAALWYACEHPEVCEPLSEDMKLGLAGDQLAAEVWEPEDFSHWEKPRG